MVQSRHSEEELAAISTCGIGGPVPIMETPTTEDCKTTEIY